MSDIARVVARLRVPLAATVKVVELADLPEKGDVSDWLDAGHPARALVALAEATPAFDNVDKPIRWLEDALATASTGIQISKRRLHTTNEEAVYEARAFLGLTARTPRFRREDVASRIGTALGQAELTRAVLQKSKRSQHIYATEEDPLYNLLLEWIERTAPRRSDLEPVVSNNGRRMPTTDLFTELRALAETLGARFTYANPKVLGKRLQGLEEALGETFLVEHNRTRASKWWSFKLRENGDDNELV